MVIMHFKNSGTRMPSVSIKKPPIKKKILTLYTYSTRTQGVLIDIVRNGAIWEAEAFE